MIIYKYKNKKETLKRNQNSDHFFILSNFQPQFQSKGVITSLKWEAVLLTSSLWCFCMRWWTLLSKLRCYLEGTNRKTVPAQQFCHFLHSGASAFISFFLSEHNTLRRRSRFSEMYSKKKFGHWLNNLLHGHCNDVPL